ncbi:ABC transporter substrate-binding protein [Pelagibacterium halotolerans]|uniref:Putative iron compound-binding protein of ABC transporter family n=1 Tax=Pelagibacterium halotolerans (strain DSM 22347 / JCM 15775 / CGMCC 1.7692 / B2) TaxID=1082931 RepID=G4R8B0_PELHB|nr:ABC transporter substrate-binding protein [Pelagibacterium halotolerans]AEQ52354.1 putative iron compound-binding protein of ABC transporter family [Pelagibacterium halotolerans B2]QJR17907.1 ABC transporter substrate-binding protein [Pelagibacterium halotolerans]SEA34122.1 iron complex transport system substrate-binding protein [Pelagibacterium halotolerans]
MKTRLTVGMLAALLTITSVTAQETRSFTDDAGRTVEIPADPQRIVSLQDLSITIPLIELGVYPVASHGRTTESGEGFIRSSKVLTGVDFDNSDIAFVGNLPVDVEAVAAAEPDLIITTPWQTAPVEQLEAVAPTIVLDDTVRGDFGMYEALAEITGTTDTLAVLEGRYDSQIEQIKRLIDTSSISVNVIQGVDGEVLSWHTYGGLGRVLRDAGFAFPERVDAIPEGEFARMSAEALPELDADFLFVTYRTDTLETPEDAFGHLEQVMPNFCDFLHACRENQMIVMPREEASASSYYALGVMAYTVISHISGRRFDPLAE